MTMTESNGQLLLPTSKDLGLNTVIGIYLLLNMDEKQNIVPK